MRYKRLIKNRLNALNSTQKRFVDIFKIMHGQDGLFCEQISNRFFARSISYADIKRLSQSVATALASKDYARDSGNSEADYSCNNDNRDAKNAQRMGIKMANCFEFVVMFWGVILSGNVPVLINTEFDEAVTNEIRDDLQIAIIFDLSAAQNLIKSAESKSEYNKPEYNKSEKDRQDDFDYSRASDEIVLTTTGSTGRCKYCFYDGKAVANFINKTPFIVKKIPQIVGAKNIKHLAVLPLYHIFGLFAVYFWFSFFGKSFLFVESVFSDLMHNIRSFKVTHIFAVPLLFNSIKREVYRQAEQSGRLCALEEGLARSYKIQSKLPLPRKLLHKKFAEVRDKTLGDVRFMISGGAPIGGDTLRLFNCMGYDLHAGFGMTELGITSLNLCRDIKSRCTPSIGQPLPNVTYRLGQDNALDIMCDTAAFKVLLGGRESTDAEASVDTIDSTEQPCVDKARQSTEQSCVDKARQSAEQPCADKVRQSTEQSCADKVRQSTGRRDLHETRLDERTFYRTNDRCFRAGGQYFFEARSDEIIAAENGENYNLCALQSEDYGTAFPESFCFIPYKNNVALLVSLSGQPKESAADTIEKIRNNPVLHQKKVSCILLTEDALVSGLKLVNHRTVAAMLQSGAITATELSAYVPHSLERDSVLARISAIAARALDIENAAGLPENADLFLEMGSSSFDYYVIMQDVAAEFGLDVGLLLPSAGFGGTAPAPAASAAPANKEGEAVFRTLAAIKERVEVLQSKL